MYQQKYDAVLRTSDDSQEEDSIKLPEDNYLYTTKSFQVFQQLEKYIDKEITLKYQPICVVGISCNSIVFKCKLRASHEKQGQQQIPVEYFVIKIYPHAKVQATILNRISKLQQCKFLVKMKEFYQYSIVFQPYQGNLKELIVNNLQLPTKIVIKVFKQCLHALAILQKYKIVHGDIKPENIFYKSHNRNIEYFVLSDFSNSFQIVEKQERQCMQTWAYRAPQWLKNNVIEDNKIDIWSLGCVLFECITGQNFLPLQIKDAVLYEEMFRKYGQQQTIKVRLARHSFPTQINAFGTLLTMMLSEDPKKRPTIKFLIQAFQKIQ